MATPTDTITPEQRQMLLRVARQTALSALDPAHPAAPDRPRIDGSFGGAFVTFWSGPRMRGCVGSLRPTEDIVGSVQEATRAALRDARFATHAIDRVELKRLTIEVSVLSHLEQASAPAELIVGTHGIVIRKGEHSGCFLPKVAAERGWSPEEFLANCCTMKAGLPADAWKGPDAVVMLFTADVFSEPETLRR